MRPSHNACVFLNDTPADLSVELDTLNTLLSELKERMKFGFASALAACSGAGADRAGHDVGS